VAFLKVLPPVTARRDWRRPLGTSVSVARLRAEKLTGNFSYIKQACRNVSSTTACAPSSQSVLYALPFIVTSKLNKCN